MVRPPAERVITGRGESGGLVSAGQDFIFASEGDSMIYVSRKEHFNAAHRLYNERWSEEQNRATFGKCSLPHYHGHNYELEIKVVGEVDPVTGFVMDLKLLSDLVNEEVIERFDHKNLNVDTEEFKELNPTAENIAIVIHDLLRPRIDPSLDLYIRLFETPRNYVEYPVEGKGTR